MSKDKEVKSDNKRLEELERKFAEFESIEQKYRDEIYQMHLYRIDQIIDEIDKSWASTSITFEKVKTIASYFFKKGVEFGKGDTISFAYDKQSRTLN